MPKTLIGFVFYCAFGLLIQIITYPGNPDFHLAFTWVFMILWPLFVLWWFIYWMLVVSLCVAIIALIWITGYRRDWWGQ